MTAEWFSRFLEVLCGNEVLDEMNASGICIHDNAQPHIRISDIGVCNGCLPLFCAEA